MCNTFVRQLADKRNRTGDKFGRVSDVRLKLCQTEKPCKVRIVMAKFEELLDTSLVSRIELN